MAVDYKDYYRTLGISRTASAEDIRKAFRRLARECHPDVARNQEDPDGLFRDINEAYEVLSDPDKRQKYDHLSTNWPNTAGWRPTADTQRGATFEFRFGGTGFSDFFEQLFGSGAASNTRTPPPADSPESEFAERGEDVESDILVSTQEVLRGSVRPISLQRKIPCPQCYGTGSANAAVCAVCLGEGQVTRRDKYQVRIPPGVREGQRLRLPGQGDASQGPGRAGDLYLRVRFARHPDFKFEGPHLLCEIEIAPWEAVLGAHISVPTLEGKVNIRVPAGSQNGQRLRVREQGLPVADGVRGDLYVLLQVRVPQQLTDREKALWVQLASESSFRPRQRPGAV